MKIDTRLVQAGGRWNQTSDDKDRRNGVRRTLEAVLATIEGGGRTFAFSSGQTAVHALVQTFETGTHFLVSRDLSPDTARILEHLREESRIRVTRLDTSDTDTVRLALDEAGEGAVLLVENPSHHLLHGSDLRSLSWEVHRRKGFLVVDSTALTPVLQRPLDFGADVVLQLGARNLAGTTEVQAGFVTTRLSHLIAKLDRLQSTTAALLSSYDAWQVLHGLKTLSLRLVRQEESARRLARWLSTHPRVSVTWHPSLDGHEGGERIRLQATGTGTVVSFRIVEPVLVPGFLRALRLWKATEGQAGVESLVAIPAAHPASAEELAVRRELGVDEGFVRLSVGIEDVQDLIDDLDQALNNPATGFSEVWDYVI